MNTKKASLWHLSKTLLWALFGVRSKGGLHEDEQRIRPMMLLAGGMVMLVCFVAALIVIVKMVVAV